MLGGTFNPPHLGHLAVARHAREQLRLDRVLLIPAHTPPHKPAGEDPGPEHRLRMCELLADDVEGLSACPLEVDRGGPSYTVDTLDAIHASNPDARLTFIVGADAASTLPSWREPAKLLGLAGLAVAARPGAAREQVLDAVAGLVGTGASGGRPQDGGITFLDMPEIDISSSTARLRAARGEPIEGLVGPAVARYVAEHRLYRGPMEAER
ncbi:MAG TPA: nicotinate (nicotinamide) nucleotide adenylyltransferase [Solirubrobacteraceae bacterium]|nr:nicotinate (nicotinamide) nucleotide adenylyltransferase [Solirubrobacteraceae bacterium]